MKSLLIHLARWVLRRLDPTRQIKGPIVYALIRNGDLVAGVSTNKHRVQAEAVAAACRDEDVTVLRYVPVGRWSPEPTVKFRRSMESEIGAEIPLETITELVRKTGGGE